jgi:hypothetical protein
MMCNMSHFFYGTVFSKSAKKETGGCLMKPQAGFVLLLAT